MPEGLPRQPEHTALQSRDRPKQQRVSVTDTVRNVTAQINTASTHQAEVHMHTRQASARRHEQTAGATQIRYFAVHAS